LKIKAKTLLDEIIEELQRAIILSERKPVDPLVERGLAEHFKAG
jgi:DNA-binding GntR family transcriptional regulator